MMKVPVQNVAVVQSKNAVLIVAVLNKNAVPIAAVQNKNAVLIAAVVQNNCVEIVPVQNNRSVRHSFSSDDHSDKNVIALSWVPYYFAAHIHYLKRGYCGLNLVMLFRKVLLYNYRVSVA